MKAVPFTIYEENGQVVCSGLGDPDTLEKRCGPGRMLLNFIAPDNTYIQSGAAVAIPLRPSEWYVFDYDTKQWADGSTNEDHWRVGRGKRNALLTASDWTQILDAPTDKEAWATYRQQLRDVTKQPDPRNITWPSPPKL